MGFLEWVVANQLPLYFYLAVILIIIVLRKKIDWQAPAVGLYRTKIGVKFMKRMAENHRELFKWLGYVGIGVGFTGMAFIIYTLIDGLWKLVFVPSAPAVIAPVIPGFTIPGVGISVPLIHGWLALFVVVVIHEFSHGVVSKAHKIPVESSGLLVFGPILGAFVEPKEAMLKKADDHVQWSVFAAGPFSNILSAIFFAAIITAILAPLLGFMSTPSGVELVSVTPELPAAQAGLADGMIITSVNGVPITDTTSFVKEVEYVRPEETVTFTTDEGADYAVVAAVHPDDAHRGYLGVNFQDAFTPRSQDTWFLWLLRAVQEIYKLVKWIILLSLGIGLANLLPLGPVDGGRMLQILLFRLHGEEKGTMYWKNISKITLVVILILLIIPIVKGFF